MITAWFLVGAAASTLASVLMYFCARIFNSLSAYVMMIVLPLILNLVIYVVLRLLLNVPVWYLAGVVFSLFLAFMIGVLLRYTEPLYAYLAVLIVPFMASLALYAIINLIIKFSGVVKYV